LVQMLDFGLFIGSLKFFADALVVAVTFEKIMAKFIFLIFN